MRGFRFTAKNIGDERYLTYIMGEGCELDEDALDICEDGVSGLVGIIYEEDDDYDYLTYDITGKTALDNYTKGTVDKKTVFTLVRNVAKGIIEFKEVGIPLSYILLNRNFMYVNPDTLEIEYICLPVESEGSVAAEFKGFMRQFIANLMYNVDEDLNYVGQLITYINGDSFNLRGLVGLVEALMKDAGIDYEADGDIATADGDVVVSTDVLTSDQGVSSYMDELEDADGDLPEIGDDEEEEEDIEVSEAEEEDAEEETEEAQEETEETEAEAEEETVEEEEEEDDDDGPETVTIADIRAAQKSVKVNRVALIQNNAHGEEEKQAEEENKAKKKDNSKGKKKEKAEAKPEAPAAPEPQEVDAAAVAAAEVSETADIKINPYIVRETTNERAMINKPIFKLGKATRGIDYRIDGNNAISRIHAIITLKENNQYYIKDNKSTNHTYVNNVKVEPDQEVLLTNNCTITLGDEDFLFKF